MSRRRLVWVVLVLGTWVARPVPAQAPPGSRAGAPVWMPPLASVVVPGAGQLMMGHDRGAVFLAVETFFVARFFALQGEGRAARDEYHELAFTVARGPFDPVAQDTVFEYFEQMEKYIESGPFDTDPGPALVPPEDRSTFNGSLWALARETFFTQPDSLPDPESVEYRLAIDFYRRRAVGDGFRWSWRDAALEQDLFRQSIRKSDEAFRRATTQLGLLLANHVLSAIDAFVSVRLARNGHSVAVSSALWTGAQGRGVRGGIRLDVTF
ncbi:MAG TPA: hypothetical protein VGA22_01190 [Gemmatimonadales bacterium]